MQRNFILMKLHVVKLTYWNVYDRWYCNDVTNLVGRSAKWYTPMRILNLSIEEYIDLLIKYKAKGLKYYENTDFLSFYFTSESDVRRFCAYINSKAKKINYQCY